MDAETRNLVRLRAANRCEYCGLHQDSSPLAALHVEHIIPRKHHGTDDIHNLAISCVDCNLRKGTNLAGFDPETGLLTELFHPRRQKWSEHFEWHEVVITAKSATGRTTVDVLDLNSEERLELRVLSSRSNEDS